MQENYIVYIPHNSIVGVCIFTNMISTDSRNGFEDSGRIANAKQQKGKREKKFSSALFG